MYANSLKYFLWNLLIGNWRATYYYDVRVKRGGVAQWGLVINELSYTAK